MRNCEGTELAHEDSYDRHHDQYTFSSARVFVCNGLITVLRAFLCECIPLPTIGVYASTTCSPVNDSFLTILMPLLISFEISRSETRSVC